MRVKPSIVQLVAEALHAADVLRVDAMIARADERVDAEPAETERRESAHVVGIDAMVARADEVVGRQLRETVRRHAADVFRIDAVIAEADQRIDGAETVAERRHVLDVSAVDAVLRRADERAKVRRRVAGGGQRVEVGDADVGDGEIELVLRRRPADAALRQLRAERGAGLEDERARARAVAARAVDGERARLAPDREVHRGGRCERRSRQPLEIGERHRPAIRRVAAANGELYLPRDRARDEPPTCR